VRHGRSNGRLDFEAHRDFDYRELASIGECEFLLPPHFEQPNDLTYAQRLEGPARGIAAAWPEVVLIDTVLPRKKRDE